MAARWQLFTQELTRYGVATDYVDAKRSRCRRGGAAQEAAAIVRRETMSNPLVRVVDIAALAELAHHHKTFACRGPTHLRRRC